MTLEAILKNVLEPSTSSRIYHRPTGNDFFAGRTGGDFHGFGHYHKPKGKSKSDKKQAILSALSLLAFLFFLNVLQNCIREQSEANGSVFMFGHGKTSASVDEYESNEKRIRRGTETGSSETIGNEEKEEEKEEKRNGPNYETEGRKEGSRKSRNLLEANEKKIGRRKKFISDLKNGSDWTNELSKMTEKDLENHRLKTLVFPLYWKNKRLESKVLTDGNSRTKEKEKLKEMEKMIPIVFKKMKKREKSTVEKVESKISIPSSSTLQIRDDRETSRERTLEPSSTPSTSGIGVETTTVRFVRTENVGSGSEKDSDQGTQAPGPTDVARYTIRPHYYADKYRNRRGDHVIYGSGQPENGSESRETPAKAGNNEKVRYPNRLQFHRLEKVRPDRGQRPVGYGHWPYRRHGTRHRGSLHPVVAAEHPAVEPDFDPVKFALSLLTSLARPFAGLMPAFKDAGSGEPRCYELMMCEGQRVSKFMGPTAETFASTLGTVLTWAAEEETRGRLMEAIKSGKENTCRQQIKDCEEKSGGKSAMTVLAGFLETNAPN